MADVNAPGRVNVDRMVRYQNRVRNTREGRRGVTAARGGGY